VDTARRAGRLLALVPSMIDGWARTRSTLAPATVAEADLAVSRLLAVVEGEVDRLYLQAFAAAQSRVGAATSRPRPASPGAEGYASAVTAIAAELARGWWGPRATHLRRLRGDLLASAALVERSTVEDWAALARRWAVIASGEAPYALPPEPAGWSVFHDQDEAVVHTGMGDDIVRVESGVTGPWRVVVNGAVLRFPAGTRLTIRTGAGDDHVTVTGPAGVTVLGGDGNDVIVGAGGDDRLFGGPGHDYLSGGSDDDLMSGGPGEDVLYGLGGDDTLLGGEGRDYLDGGSGDDLLDGGPGHDIISGASGDDTMHAGERLYHAGVADLDLAIDVRGTDDFIARVRSDVDTLRASPAGRRMLASLGRGALRGEPLLIIEDESTSAAWTTLDLPNDRRLAVFSVCYDPTRGVSADRSPPIVGLFHELAHVYDLAHGTSAAGVHEDPEQPDLVLAADGTLVGAPNDERAAVGLPVDHDQDPNTPPRIHPEHPYELTENALRDEMGLPRRERYGRDR